MARGGKEEEIRRKPRSLGKGEREAKKEQEGKGKGERKKKTGKKWMR